MEESLYCNVCGACGEEGCCSPMICSQDTNGDYCQRYLNDLKYAYKCNKDILEYIEDNYSKESELYKKVNEILDSNLNKFYK